MDKFEYLKLKEGHFFKAYEMLIKFKWPHRLVLFEDTETPDGYYSIVSITFTDEARYFRHLHIPLPRLQRIVENGEDYAELAEEILERVNNEAIRVPRTIWGKIHIKDIVEAFKS